MSIRRAFSYVSKIDFFDPNSVQIPIFRVMDLEGEVIKGAEKYAQLEKDFLIKMYNSMIEIQEFDNVAFDLQRQGKISFYITNTGEEAVQVGCVAALNEKDLICPQYRELGVFLWRGYGLMDCMNQLYSNKYDRGQGKQKPIHYGAPELYIQHVASPLCTQVPQAAGIGYSYKLRKVEQICCAIFGDGASSEGDFHAGLNFASTLKSQVLYLCRNNQIAISTPSKQQYAGNGIAERGVGYNIKSLKCDGNDIFAVYNATKEARQIILQDQSPVLLECLTYRRGHHSTSDDQYRYRDKKQVEHWQKVDNPILRLQKFLMKSGWLSQDEAQTFQQETRKRILKMKDKAASTKLHPWQCLFDNVWDEQPQLLKQQQKELEDHLKKYKQHYDLDSYESK